MLCERLGGSRLCRAFQSDIWQKINYQVPGFQIAFLRRIVMTFPLRRIPVALFVFLIFAVSGSSHCMGQAQLEFARDIRPILADNCFKCHGPDEEHRAADLRLDQKTSVFDEIEVVVPGDVEASSLHERVFSNDPDLQMPPPDSGRTLTEVQKNKLAFWIEQGAVWSEHWSLVPPAKPSVPQVPVEDAWPANQIDRFVYAKLEEHGLSPNDEAERPTLIRRVALDLTGLPPSLEILERFGKSKGVDWYEQLVDHLLGSDHYGEHMARYWLDAARYGDTHGLHLDNYREMWPYRDWVINAFSENKSFKDFTIEQLAGDLLDNPTNAQKIATGFNRSHVSTAEGGSIKEEVYVRNVVDRVSTTGTVFMGLTVGCAQCHDHKFDPISQQEFYQLFAFFNSLDADPMDGNKKDHEPVLRILAEGEKAKLAELEEKSNKAKKTFQSAINGYEYVEPEQTVDKKEDATHKYVWVEDETPAGAELNGSWKFVDAEEGMVYSHRKSHVGRGKGLFQHFFINANTPLSVTPDDTIFVFVFLDPDDPPKEIMLQFNDGDWEQRVYWGANEIDWGADGTASRNRLGDLPRLGDWVELEIPVKELGFDSEVEVNGIAFTQFDGTVYWDHIGIHSKFDQVRNSTSLSYWIENQRKSKGKGLPSPIKELINKPLDDLTGGEFDETQLKKLRSYFLENIYPDTRTRFANLIENRDVSAKEFKDFRDSLPTTLIWREKPQPKQAYILNRGEYDQKGEKVGRATPEALPPFPRDAPSNRLGLAQWLVSENHPLTARVTVNRFWQQVFGTGIVKTTEDFGAQGEVPSHPELLDWLAVDFVEHGWDVRRLMKQMVMSATYRQSAVANQKKLRIDPDNRLYARGPRYRLDAEILRDQSLAVSGLLVPKIGGPSVKPPQPDGLWFVVGYSRSNTVRFKKDEGADKVHRRSLYTFWKRTAPPPQMNTFDAPSRESCTVRRERTNTPLQALLLMNDPQYIETARYLASSALDSIETVKARSPESISNWDEAIAAQLFRRAMVRQASEKELTLLVKAYKEHLANYKKHPEDAAKLVAIGEVPAEAKYEKIELASWTMIANLVMNMDEFVTKN